MFLNGTWKDHKSLYNFFESTIDALRPSLKEGTRSIILADPAITNRAQLFNEHVRTHHSWLTQGPGKATFSGIRGPAGTTAEVAILARNPLFSRLISETTQKETEGIIELLEKRLNATDEESTLSYALREIEKLVFAPKELQEAQLEYLLLTDKYVSSSREKQRINHLMQIAANRNIKTRVIPAESPSGRRVEQLGGMVLIKRNLGNVRPKRA